jgi:hypothetical protein
MPARRHPRRRHSTTSAHAAVVAAAYGLLYAIWGFDVLGALQSAEVAYRNSIASERPYAFWLLGSPTAFMVALGLPVAWLVLRGAARREPTAVALVGLVVVSAVLGYTKAETERIWLFLVPPACLAAAAQLRGRLGWLLAALAIQAIAVQAFFDTRY